MHWRGLHPCASAGLGAVCGGARLAARGIEPVVDRESSRIRIPGLIFKRLFQRMILGAASLPLGVGCLIDEGFVAPAPESHA